MSAVTTMTSGVSLVVTPLLPVPPSPREQARRIVRHGMNAGLPWHRDSVPLGPAPDEFTHFLPSRTDPKVIYASREIMTAMIKRSLERPDITTIPIIRETKEPASE